MASYTTKTATKQIRRVKVTKTVQKTLPNVCNPTFSRVYFTVVNIRLHLSNFRLLPRSTLFPFIHSAAVFHYQTTLKLQKF